MLYSDRASNDVKRSCARFYTSRRSYCRNVGVIDGNYPIYPIDIFNVGEIGCNFITAITSPFLHGFGRDLNQNVGEDEIYLVIYNLGGYEVWELWYNRILV